MGALGHGASLCEGREGGVGNGSKSLISFLMLSSAHVI